MQLISPESFQFQKRSKFALLAICGAYADLPESPFRLSDGTWIMTSMPVADFGVWKEWLGSLRAEKLSRANLVLIVQEPSENPGILDAENQQLEKYLILLFNMLHLRYGIGGAEGADLLCGSSGNGAPDIRQTSRLPEFRLSTGCHRIRMTKAWLEDASILRRNGAAMAADKNQFRRFVRGINTLFNGLGATGQDRLHQFVRSLEALILPDAGQTKKQFAHRCQTFAKAGHGTRDLLLEAFDMRSDTEHLNDWEKAVEKYDLNEREEVCWQRTRQIENLACDAYSRVLLDETLIDHFRSESTIAAFWKLPDDEKRAIWGEPIDLR